MNTRPGNERMAMDRIRIKVRKKAGWEDFELPRYLTPGAAGVDIMAAVEEEVVIVPGEIKFIPAGIYIALPDGFEAQLRPRSGLALKKGLGIVNSPGTIDSDYRGEVGVIMINHGREQVTITRGMRMAQMVVQRVVRANWQEVEELDSTSRGGGGFGHSGH